LSHQHTHTVSLANCFPYPQLCLCFVCIYSYEKKSTGIQKALQPACFILQNEALGSTQSQYLTPLSSGRGHVPSWRNLIVSNMAPRPTCNRIIYLWRDDLPHHLWLACLPVYRPKTFRAWLGRGLPDPQGLTFRHMARRLFQQISGIECPSQLAEDLHGQIRASELE
jgi:hypothetical protein